MTGTQIDELKAVAIMVVTDELAKFGDSVAGNLFATELSNAVAVETDETFIAALILSATSIASGGATAEHVRNRFACGLLATDHHRRTLAIVFADDLDDCEGARA